MQILHIASGDFFSTYGGGQVYVKNVVDKMIDNGADVCVVSRVSSGEKVICKNYKGIKLFEITSPDMLGEAIKLVKPDVIHAHSMKAEACKIGRALDVPVVVTSHHGGILCPAGTRLNCKDEICHASVNHKECLPCILRNIPGGRRLWYPLMRHLPESTYKKLGKFLTGKHFIPFVTPIGIAAKQISDKQSEWFDICRDCTLMVAPCHEIADAMVLNGLHEDKIRVIPHGIPLPKERPTYPSIIDGKVKFYYVGRICYVKGIHVMLEAFHSVDNPAIELHLIGGAGNKQERRYMDGLQKKYVKDKRIIWHGKVAPEDVFEVTRNYHVSSAPSTFLEAFGLNIAEALALGKPVLATRCGGGEMQIKDGVNGWLVPPNNPHALASKIKYIVDNQNLMPEMSLNCHAIALSHHIVTLLYDVYKEALNYK